MSKKKGEVRSANQTAYAGRDSDNGKSYHAWSKVEGADWS